MGVLANFPALLKSQHEAWTNSSEKLSAKIRREFALQIKLLQKNQKRDKGKSIRSETDNKGQKYYVILKDQKLWSWSDKDKNGLLIDISDTQSKAQTGQKSEEDIIDEVEQHKENCKPTVVSDSMFNPPSDINFQDLGQMFKNFGVTIKP